MGRDYVKGQRTVRTAEGREFAIIRGRRWTRVPEYLSNGQLTARFFVDEATGEVREADSWKSPKRWPLPAAAAAFVRELLTLPDAPEGAQPAAEHGPYDGYMTKVGAGWEVAARGVVFASGVEREEVARAVLAEHGAGVPCWKVDADGAAERIG